VLSQTVEYALRAMLHLASREGEVISADRIADTTDIPAGYLAKIMRDLVVAGQVLSFRGPGGGFSLARDPARVTLLDIVNAVDPIVRIDRCPLRRPCREGLCALHRRLDDAVAVMERSLSSTTLADLMSGEGRMPRGTPPRRESRDAV
jgi:Rrf2 family protein